MSGKVRGVLIDISPLRESAAFRRIFCARLISIIGIGLLMVSVPIQMYDLTRSSAQVGAATLFSRHRRGVCPLFVFRLFQSWGQRFYTRFIEFAA